MIAHSQDGGLSLWRHRWRFLTGALAFALGLLWLLLTLPLRPCDACGAAPAPVTALTPGVVASADSTALAYSPGWQVRAAGADPAEPADAFTTPAGVITFTYTGDALWLRLAPGDYWAYLYATVDGRPANRLTNIAGNADSTGATAGYTTLLAPEVAGQPEEARLRWVEIHRASPFPEAHSTQADAHTVRLEFWRGWGQTPLRGVAVDPPPGVLLGADARQAMVQAPRWPGVLLLLAGLWLVGAAVVSLRKRIRPRATPSLRIIRVLDVRSTAQAAGALLSGGALLAAFGAFAGVWPVTLLGLAAIGLAGLARPASWFAALLFALPFAYAVKLPLLPGRALDVIDVGVAGGVLVLAGHFALRWPAGRTQAPPRPRRGGAVLLMLALLASWALVASVDVRYPALALREWRVLFLNPLLFAATLVMLLRHAPQPGVDRWLLVSGWLAGAAVVALIGLWGFATGEAFVSAAEGVRRVQALYDSANNLALYLDRTLAVALALLLLTPNGRARLLWAVLVAPQGLAWLLTFSKGSLLLAAPAMLLVLGVGGFWLLRRQQRSAAPLVVIGVVVAAAALVMAPFVGAERFQRLLDFEQGTGFLRIQLWRSAWQMALDHSLLGVGPDQFLYYYRSNYLLPAAWQEPNLNHPHNVLLDWWTRLGLPGLVLGIGWLGAGVWGIWRWLRRSVSDTRVAALALGALAAAAAGLAHGLIDVSYALPELMLVWVLIFHLEAGDAASTSGATQA